MKELAYKLLYFTSDKTFNKIKYFYRFKRKLNLEYPKTFNEKLQWLKLNNRKSEHTTMVDKYKVREYISRKIGDEYLIPLIGVWNNPEEIEFDTLPNQFVLKCNHNSGEGLIICKDKSNLNIKKAKKELIKAFKHDYYKRSREWPYKDVEKKIICEEYLVDETGKELKDYKFFCFDGKVKYIMTGSNRFSNLRVTFFDRNWNVAPFRRFNVDIDPSIPKPKNFDKMIEIAELLSKNEPFIRVDLYEVNNKILFGELTFFPASGLKPFYPEEWDFILGDMINLDLIKNWQNY